MTSGRDDDTVVAMGEIHLRPEMSATVSSATIETMTMSSGAGGPVDVGRVSTSVTNPPLPGLDEDAPGR